jgi:hypothetical protein
MKEAKKPRKTWKISKKKLAGHLVLNEATLETSSDVVSSGLDDDIVVSLNMSALDPIVANSMPSPVDYQLESVPSSSTVNVAHVEGLVAPEPQAAEPVQAAQLGHGSSLTLEDDPDYEPAPEGETAEEKVRRNARFRMRKFRSKFSDRSKQQTREAVARYRARKKQEEQNADHVASVVPPVASSISLGSEAEENSRRKKK